MDTYLLLGPEEDRNTVEVWSQSRLPFEPKGRLLEMHQSLRATLAKLKPGKEAILQVVYTSEQLDPCDVENILLYNVGTGSFRHLCERGLFLERRTASVPPLPGYSSAAAFPHHHSYSTGSDPAVASCWKRGPVLASWADIPCRPLTSSTKPHTVWYLMKRSTLKLGSKESSLSGPAGYYGISIQIGVPGEVKPNLAGIIKPLLDGTISAFHCHVGQDAPVVSQRIASRLGRDEGVIRSLLADLQGAVLGERRLVYPYGEGVQWNPADDRFMQVKVEISEAAVEDGWTLSGEIYPLLAA